jgi:hypothetical protein
MEKVNECGVLTTILKEPPHCQSTCSGRSITPSFIRDASPEGCLIAHTMLTLIETQRLAPHFREPLRRMIELNGPKELPNVSSNYAWNLTLAMSLLHDLGKLSDQYVRGPRGKDTPFGHHQLSAIIAHKTLSKTLHDYIATVVAYAIIFHHEALDWRNLESSIFSFNYLMKVFTSLKAIQYTAVNDRLRPFSDNLDEALKQLCEKGFLLTDQYDFLFRVSTRALQELSDNRRAPLYVGRALDVTKTRKPNVTALAFFLYRLLYLADNRAASARSRYWLDLLKEVDWNSTEKIAEQIYHILTRRSYYIGLSAIPEDLAT